MRRFPEGSEKKPPVEKCLCVGLLCFKGYKLELTAIMGAEVNRYTRVGAISSRKGTDLNQRSGIF